MPIGNSVFGNNIIPKANSEKKKICNYPLCNDDVDKHSNYCLIHHKYPRIIEENDETSDFSRRVAAGAVFFAVIFIIITLIVIRINSVNKEHYENYKIIATERNLPIEPQTAYIPSEFKVRILSEPAIVVSAKGYRRHWKFSNIIEFYDNNDDVVAEYKNIESIVKIKKGWP